MRVVAKYLGNTEVLQFETKHNDEGLTILCELKRIVPSGSARSGHDNETHRRAVRDDRLVAFDVPPNPLFHIFVQQDPDPLSFLQPQEGTKDRLHKFLTEPVVRSPPTTHDPRPKDIVKAV